MPSGKEDMEKTVELLQYQVDLLGHMLSTICAYLDIDFDELLSEAEREINRPPLKLVKK